jgi:hypothetical protein
MQAGRLWQGVKSEDREDADHAKDGAPDSAEDQDSSVGAGPHSIAARQHGQQ